MQSTSIRSLLITTSYTHTARLVRRITAQKSDIYSNSISWSSNCNRSTVQLVQDSLLPSSWRPYTTTPRRTAAAAETNKMSSQSQPLPTSQAAWQLESPTRPIESHMKLNQTAPVPKLKPNQTLIRVLSASINPADYKIAEVGFLSKLMVGWPHTPGMDYLGRVWSTTLPTSEGVKDGDLVFGKHDGPVQNGTLGQYTIVNSANNIAHVPDLSGVQGVDLDWYAGAGVVGLTAYQCLTPHLGKGLGEGKGKSVFINGGSGGTGIFGIQIAKHILACDDVVVSCSGANADLCKSLGADEVIDYRSQNVIEALRAWTQRKGKKFDLLVDNVGKDPNLYWHCHDYLATNAKYVWIGGSFKLKEAASMVKMMLWPGFLGGGKRKFVLTMVKTDRTQLTSIGNWIKEGKIKGVVDQTFPFEEAAKAFERLKTGRARGKIIVRVNEDGR